MSNSNYDKNITTSTLKGAWGDQPDNKKPSKPKSEAKQNSQEQKPKRNVWRPKVSKMWNDDNKNDFNNSRGYGNNRNNGGYGEKRRNNGGGRGRFADLAPDNGGNNWGNSRYNRNNRNGGGYSGGYGSNRRNNRGRKNYEDEIEIFGNPKDKENEVSGGINFDNYDKIEVSVTGKDIPEGVESFEALNLPESISKNIKRIGFVRPTPVQKNAVPIALAKRDLMSCAQTGSGKTGAFLIPIIAGLIPPPKVENAHSGSGYRMKVLPFAVIMAPTRELAKQIYGEARKFCFRTGLRSCVVYGGKNLRQQIQDLRIGCDLLIATPGRLIDLSERGIVGYSEIRYLALDEADRMLDMGFEPQIRQVVEGYDMPQAGVRQTLMFSATFPKEIRNLALDFLSNYIYLTIGRVGSTTDLILQEIQYIEDSQKTNQLIEELQKCEGLTLIFVQMKRTADYLEDYLAKLGVNAVAIHGDRSQQDREYALRHFKRGECPVLVATDLASRGWDIPNVRHVINYDLPTHIEDYVHRIGRTGRCGQKGSALSFCTEQNAGICGEIVTLLEETKNDVPQWLRELARYGGRKKGGKRGFGNRYNNNNNRYGNGSRYGNNRRDNNRGGDAWY